MPTPTSQNLDGKAFAIGILGVTACILFVGLLLVTQTPAHAFAMNDRGGDYIMLTQQLSLSTEGVVVIDAAAKRMLIYSFDYNTKTLEPLRGWNLDALPRPREQAPPAPARK
jgi:hypothetical protein